MGEALADGLKGIIQHLDSGYRVATLNGLSMTKQLNCCVGEVKQVWCFFFNTTEPQN